MKKSILLLALLLLLQTVLLKAQVGIGTSTPQTSSQLEVVSTSKGILLPRMTRLQRLAIPSPANGLIVYQSDATTGIYFFDNNQWHKTVNTTLELDTQYPFSQGDITSTISTNNTTPGTTILKLIFDGIDNPNASESYIRFISIGNSGVNIRGAITGTGGGTQLVHLKNSSPEAAIFAAANGVVFSSSGADYAEYIIKEDSSFSVLPGDIVGIKEGKVVASNTQADRYMTVSQKPIVVGNQPAGDIRNHVLVAFVGQVYVKVKGLVRSGDYIIASDESGTGIAKHPENLSGSDLKKIIGQAWETNTSEELKVVKTGVTPMDMSLVQSNRIDALEKNLESLLQNKKQRKNKKSGSKKAFMP